VSPPDKTLPRILFAAGSLFAVLVALLAQHLHSDRADASTAPEPTAAAADKDEPVATTARRGMRMVTKKFKMSRPNEKRRLTVRCPGNRWPMGGGVKTNPPLSAGGEGVYPHSYERLGVQGGFHTTPVLWDPSPRSTQRRTVKLQVMCGRKLGKVTPPHSTKYVKPGKTKTVIATCPGRRHLFGGGFQRTDFISRGGNYVTESHAISSKSWKVVASAFGNFGGEITAIAYCTRSKRPLLREVSGSTTIGHGQVGTARTAPCPGKSRLVYGGFHSSPSGSVFMADGHFKRDGSWSTSAFNRFGPTATLTAYGYCL
jgi:hypothetical protein